MSSLVAPTVGVFGMLLAWELLLSERRLQTITNVAAVLFDI
jgi:hypothetical protein